MIWMGSLGSHGKFYFEYIIKKHGKKTDNPSIRIYVNKIETRTTFTIRIECYLMPETIKLPGSAKCRIIKDENGKNLSCLEITEVALVHCNIVNNDNKHNSRVLYTFVPNKSFGQLLDISTLYF